MPQARCHHGNTTPRYANGRCKTCKAEADAARYVSRRATQAIDQARKGKAFDAWFAALSLREQRLYLRRLKRSATTLSERK